MNWINFLKPNWKKLLLATTLFILSFYLVSCFRNVGHVFEGPVIAELIKEKPHCAVFRIPLLGGIAGKLAELLMGFYFAWAIGGIYFLWVIAGISPSAEILLIVWVGGGYFLICYLSSCIVFWIYNKVKKKIK